MAYTTQDEEDNGKKPVEPTSFLSRVLYNLNRVVGDWAGMTESAGFLSDEQRAELEASLSGVDKKELAKAKQDILTAKIAEMQQTGEDPETRDILQNYVNNGTSPKLLDDLALAAYDAKGKMTVMEKISIFIEGVVDGIAGHYEAGTEIVDKSQMGFFERIQARIGEVGGFKYRQALQKELTALAEKNGTSDQLAGRMEEILNGAQLAAFKETGKMVGMGDVTSTELVGIFAKNDTPGQVPSKS